MAQASSTRLLLSAWLVLALSHVATAFWIIPHHSLVSQRLDPILSNSTSSHAHAFVGSAAILPGQKKSEMCTTSSVKADRSNYWAPQLYYYHGNNKTFDTVPLSYVNTYYLNRYGPNIKEKAGALKAYPKGFKMIAGNASLYHGADPDTTKAKAVSFVCLNAHGGNQTTTLPDGPCPWGLRTQIVFPSCWNGKDLDSANHQSHVAYPVGGQADTGDCPRSHPVKLPTLFYEFVWGTEQLQRHKKSGFVLSNGDAVGHSMHADFVAGWNVGVLQKAIDTCTGNLFQDLKSCPPFVASLKQEDKAAGQYCSTSRSVISESVLGTGKKHLPGCQVVQNGPFKGAGSGKCVIPKAVIRPAAPVKAGGDSSSKTKPKTQRHSSASKKRLARLHRAIAESL
ncbi:unnamed protein product [Parajaminaea phylloscopi]